MILAGVSLQELRILHFNSFIETYKDLLSGTFERFNKLTFYFAAKFRIVGKKFL